MKTIKKIGAPHFFTEYKTNFPEDDWKNGFKKNAGKQPNIDVKEQLKKEQKGLCVYCEIDLRSGEGYATDDFRVEHFFPENPLDKDKRNDGINYALHWPNMFACCHGGSVSTVVDKQNRYTNPDVSCDVKKENENWTNDLLNPLVDIAPFPRLFDFDEDGHIFVTKMQISEEIRRKAKCSIELLRLDSKRLQKNRKATIDKLRQQISENIELGLTENESLRDLALTYLVPDSNGFYGAFFTLVRWYLADIAEQVLKEHQYSG